MSHTRYEWTLIDYAIWTAGAVTVPVYETSSAEQAEWILSDSRRAGVLRGDGGLRGGSSTGCGTGCRRWSTSGGSSRRTLGTQRTGALAWLTEAGTAVEDRAVTERAAAGQGVRPGHDHLHLGHYRTAQGLRADPPQPAGRRAQRVPRAAGDLSPGPGRQHAAVPAARARLRPDHRGGLHRGRRRARALRGPERSCCPRWPPSGPRSSWPCRGCSRRSTTAPSRRRQRAQGSDLRPGGPDRDRLQPGSGFPARAGARPAGPARAVRPAGLRQAAGRARRPRPLRRLRRRRAHAAARATSSAARASRCCRGGA